ncbi:MAG: cation diffusion facilitator family transporter [Leptolyngbyaceae cyanobacterium]
MNAELPQRRISYRLLLTTLWITLLVLGIEAIAGWSRQSLLLMAEALHTFVDAFSTVLSLIALASPQRPQGQEIWGHGRSEVAGTLLVVTVLGFTGLTLILAAFQQFAGSLWGLGGQPFPATVDRPMVYLIAVLIAIEWVMAFYGRARSRALNSTPLALNARHTLQDAWLSAVTLGGLIAVWQDQTWVDPCLTLVLTPLVGRSLWRVLTTQLPMLLRPMAIAPEAIAHIVTQVEGVTRCMRIRSRGLVGRQVWVELRLAIHPEFAGVAHIVGERVDAALRSHYGPLRTQIWVEDTPPQLDLSHDAPWQPTQTPERDW